MRGVRVGIGERRWEGISVGGGEVKKLDAEVRRAVRVLFSRSWI
jgi:hypothetical protein